MTVAAVGVALRGLVLLVSREQSAVFSPRPTTETASSKATAPLPTAKSSGGSVASQPRGDSSAGREGERVESGQAPSAEPGALPHAAKTGTPPSPADGGRGGQANPPCSRVAHTGKRGGRQGCPLCSRTAHSGLIGSGPRWMVCRVPVAQFHATGADARSLRLPGHPLENG